MTTYTVVQGHFNQPIGRRYRVRAAAFALMERLNALHSTRTYPYAVLIQYGPNLRVPERRESKVTDAAPPCSLQGCA